MESFIVSRAKSFHHVWGTERVSKKDLKPQEVEISPKTGRPFYTWISVLQLPTRLLCTKSRQKVPGGLCQPLGGKYQTKDEEDLSCSTSTA